MNIERRSFTDFDAVMEWRNRAWLVFEVKHNGKGVPIGQRLALERFVMDATANGKYATAAVADHFVYDPHEDIYLRECLVRQVFTSGEFIWRPTKRVMTARELMRDFISMVDSNINRQHGR